MPGVAPNSEMAPALNENARGVLAPAVVGAAVEGAPNEGDAVPNLEAPKEAPKEGVAGAVPNIEEADGAVDVKVLAGAPNASVGGIGLVAPNIKGGFCEIEDAPAPGAAEAPKLNAGPAEMPLPAARAELPDTLLKAGMLADLNMDVGGREGTDPPLLSGGKEDARGTAGTAGEFTETWEPKETVRGAEAAGGATFASEEPLNVKAVLDALLDAPSAVENWFVEAGVVVPVVTGPMPSGTLADPEDARAEEKARPGCESGDCTGIVAVDVGKDEEGKNNLVAWLPTGGAEAVAKESALLTPNDGIESTGG